MYDHGYKDILSLARLKLNPNQDFPRDRLAQLACLAIRIGLDFDASREIGRQTEVELVESYMRIVFAIPEHREYMRAGTPSEPILAEAAAQLLNSSPREPLDKLAPNALNEAFQNGFLARGERGEMVGRLLWTLAHDQVSRKNNEYGEVTFHKPILVLDFLRALFHNDHWEVILNAKPMGDENGPTLSQAFDKAYIQFSHFVDTVDLNVELQQVYRLLLRGAALSCKRGQESIDFLTPILFGPPDSTALRRSNTSVLQAQIKNRNSVRKVIVDPTLVQSDSKHPVLSLVHELGTMTSSVKYTSHVGELHARHYQIVSHGCSSKTFGVIPGSVDDIYPMLLGSNLLMDDFPRSEKQTCKTLFRQLQPCTGLEVGEQCAWFGEDVQ